MRGKNKNSTFAVAGNETLGNGGLQFSDTSGNPFENPLEKPEFDKRPTKKLQEEIDKLKEELDEEKRSMEHIVQHFKNGILKKLMNSFFHFCIPFCFCFSSLTKKF